jgi:hypothetical protein
MLRRLLVLGQRGDRDKVGTGNTFPLERYLKSSIVALSCNLPWIDVGILNDRLWSRRYSQKMIFDFKGGYSARFVRSPMWGYTMHG